MTETADWTADPETGRSNSSRPFKDMCAEVARLLGEGSGSALDRHWIASRAALIVAQLAHVHHLTLGRPDDLQITAGALDRDLRTLLGGHVAVISAAELEALAQLESTIGKVREEAGR